ncbi:MAG: hypothetical protein R3C61_26820 [Bacteroidia bacterium]
MFLSEMCPVFAQTLRSTPCWWINKALPRLAPFPDMDFGLQETNGWQNYQNWEENAHPHSDGGCTVDKTCTRSI